MSTELAPQGQVAEQLPGEVPPEIGQWFWVTGSEDDEDEKKRLGCITHIGSNYIRITYVEDGSSWRIHEDGSSWRIHEDSFWKRVERVFDADAILRGNAERCRRELDGLLEDVKLLTTKLGVSPSPALGAGEASGVSLVLAQGAPADAYKQALIKAKEETLPELFRQIKEKSKEYSTWLSGQVIPLEAEAEKLEPAIGSVKDRIFSVELYAGLCETVEQIRDGQAAELTAPVHLFQRRLYMDEECLANYDTGGMEFKNLREFERWLLRKDNFERIFPFPRTVVSFRVRHHTKEREVAGMREFVRMLDDVKADKLTFLYIRNGRQVFRLRTSVEFSEKLFPDTDHPVLSAGEGKLYAKLDAHGDEPKIITEAEYEAMRKQDDEAHAEYVRKCKENEKKPKKDRGYVWSPDRKADRYIPFTRESVRYDDIGRHIRGEMEKHNRIVLVLQGLLDRSPALHPHPPWRLFDDAGFRQALVLHRDADRVLSPGDKPDFEAYRARLNASITKGTVTIGQEDAWMRFEARKENTRRDHDSRWSRIEYRPDKFKPDGDPGPGRFARVLRTDKQGHAHYRWTKERRGEGPPVLRKYGCKVSRLLNVDAYQVGDYKQFFADPRTREEYLEWAPLLLAAEEYKAGKYGEAAPLLEETPKPAHAPRPTGAAARLRMLRSLLGKAVRLTDPITTRGGDTYEKGSLWRVTFLEKGKFQIRGINPDGTTEVRDDIEEDHKKTRSIYSVSHHDFAVEPAVAPDPKFEFKPEKRTRFKTTDEGED